ncbi:MAG: mobile mystery protein A [Bacteroidales bacterium]|nr:mobile mystery protein A [Bacteroidales bacterium]
MKKNKLIIEQLDKKLIVYKNLDKVQIPPNGWVFSFRKALNMSLRQLGKRMGITPQSVKEIEEREKNGTVSIGILKQVGKALDMKFVYGFIPKNYSLKKMIEERAAELAKEIVNRTSVSMNLEDQKPSETRIKKAIQEKSEELIYKMPKYLWD